MEEMERAELHTKYESGDEHFSAKSLPQQCGSVCCSSGLQAHQSTRRTVLEGFARGGGSFVASWFLG